MGVITIDAALFAKYDDLLAQAHALTGAEAATANAKDRLASTLRQLASTRASLSHTRGRIAHHKTKLAKCQGGGWMSSNTAFSPTTWFKGGVPARIVSQSKKLEQTKREETSLESTEKQQTQAVEKDQGLLSNAMNVEAHKHGLESETRSIYETVVEANASTTLQSLRAQKAQWQSQLQFETENVATLEQVQALFDQARSEYEIATRELCAAKGINRGAQVTNIVGMAEGSEERRRLEAAERMQQMMRDRHMAEARRAVQDGAQRLMAAMQAVPAAAQQRHPNVCAGLGQVHLPEVELCGAGERMLEVFGGGVGDMVADQMADAKIDRSLHSISQCSAIVDQQRGLVAALHAALSADEVATAANLAQVGGQEELERETIFQSVRARCTATVLAVPAAQQVAQPMAQPIVAQPATHPVSTPMAQPMAVPMAQPMAAPMAQPMAVASAA